MILYSRYVPRKGKMLFNNNNEINQLINNYLNIHIPTNNN
jgi:hypothetical protein